MCSIRGILHAIYIATFRDGNFDDPKFSFFFSFVVYILRVIIDFSRFFFLFLTHLLVPRRWRSFEISMDRLLSNPRARTSMPSFHRVKRATNCTTVRTFTRTSKEPREQRWPSTRETFHEIIYWSIKMTHGGIR